MVSQRTLPGWLKVRPPGGPNYIRLKNLMRLSSLHTVCEEAHCPNIGECWESSTATFMILGDVCTRRCGFCAVTGGQPLAVDAGEPQRVAQAVQMLGLRHTVITSVTRDDLLDGGAGIFVDAIYAIRRRVPHCRVEVLVPDFCGSREALAKVMEASPDILNHNVETVPRLYPTVRPKAVYARSLELLRMAKEMGNGVLTKSGLMVGLGETQDEILHVMEDLHRNRCDILTIGQYLRPSPRHLPVDRFYAPEEFAHLKEEGVRMGFRHVESGPLVRSSYRAHLQVER